MSATDLLHDAFIFFNMGRFEAHTDLDRRYNEPHRSYHTVEHRDRVIDDANALAVRWKLPEDQRHAVVLAAAYHDAIYDPRASDNEEQSAMLLQEHWGKLSAGQGRQAETLGLAMDAIRATKDHTGKHVVSRAVNQADMSVVENPELPFADMIAWERGIQHEYQFFDWDMYRLTRVALLNQWAQESTSVEQTIRLTLLAESVAAYRPRIGVYAGSFNPFHRGHLDIVKQAEHVFDKVIVAQGVNPAKGAPDRVLADVPALRYRQTERYEGLTTDYLKSKAAHANITLIRGLRNGDDLEFEMNQIRVLQDLDPTIDVVFFHCAREFEHISSTTVRALEVLSPQLANTYKTEQP